MKTKSVFNFIVLLFIFSVAVNFANSQTDCPTGSAEWANANSSYDMGRYGPGGNVNFKYREENNEIQIIMDWTNSFQNLSDFVPNSALKKILENKAVEIAAGRSSAKQGVAKVYYKTDCFARLKLAIKLDNTTQLACCDEGASLPGVIQSRIINGTTVYYYNIYRDVKCGEKCCARVYHWEKVWDPISNSLVIAVYNPTTITIYDCSGNSGYTDCITGYPIPCQGGNCDKW